MSRRGFYVPAEYIRRHVELEADEIVYGRRAGWLEPVDVVMLALDCHLRGDSRLEPVALTLSDRYDSVDDMLEGYSLSVPLSDLEHVWEFLALRWALDSPDGLGVTGDQFDLVCGWLGYPGSTRNLMTFAPVPPGEDAGVAALDRRRRAFLDNEEQTLRRRRLG